MIALASHHDTILVHVAALTAQLEAERAARTCNGNLQVQDATAFLEEASRYFENRPTHGEDRAHWSNVHNAENCRKVISTLTREKARADKAEAEAKALREALEKIAFGPIVACPFDSEKCTVKPDEPCPVCGDVNDFDAPTNCGTGNARSIARATLAQPAAKETT